MRRALLLAALLGGCDRTPVPGSANAGTALEASAIAAGMVVDPAHAPLTGAWAREGDRLCVVPGNGHDRIGIALDYGDGQSCLGRGTANRRGDRIDIIFGDCRITAAFQGDRIVLPSVLPSSCDRLCIGRASLAALTVDRLSESTADAGAMPGPDGKPLCGAGG